MNRKQVYQWMGQGSRALKTLSGYQAENVKRFSLGWRWRSIVTNAKSCGGWQANPIANGGDCNAF